MPFCKNQYAVSAESQRFLINSIAAESTTLPVTLILNRQPAVHLWVTDGTPGSAPKNLTLPFALDRKYPAAPTEWGWQFVFPASRICRDPRWGPSSRFHVHASVVQKEVSRQTVETGFAAARHKLRSQPRRKVLPPTLAKLLRERRLSGLLPSTSSSVGRRPS